MWQVATTQYKYVGPNPSSIRSIEPATLSYCTNHFKRKKCGHSPWQLDHHKARDALKSATKNEKYTSIWDRWQRDEVYRASQLAHNWTDEWVKYLDFIAQFDSSHGAPHRQRARYNNMVHLLSLDSNRQAGPLVSALCTKKQQELSGVFNMMKDKEYLIFHWNQGLATTTHWILKSQVRRLMGGVRPFGSRV